MTPDPYENVRGAFHTAAEGLMSWNDPPESHRTRSNGTGAFGEGFLPADVLALESAAESLVRVGEVRQAIALWAIALRLRMGASDAA